MRPAVAGSVTVLAGDVGGTHARLALVDVHPDGSAAARIRARASVPTADHAGLEAPLAAFLQAHADLPPAAACLGVAATVTGRRVQGVNLPWTIDADALEAASGLRRVDLVNDFHAAACGVLLVAPGERLALGGGLPRSGAPIAVLGAGTGLGQAFLVPTAAGAAPSVVSTEGGHRDFAPRDPLQDRLLAWLRGRLGGRVSTERVLSGPGLVAIYDFLVEGEGQPRCAAVEAARAERDPARAISGAALAGDDATCAQALAVFVDVYGAEAGNVALTVLAAGGVYLAGGIAPQVLTRPREAEAFRRAFEDKGRLSAWVGGVPVWVVLTGDLGLLGAAWVASSAATR